MESTITLVLTLMSLGWRHELPPAEAHLPALVLEHLLGGTSLILTSCLLLVEVEGYLWPAFLVIISIIIPMWLILVSTLSLGWISRLLLPVVVIGDFIVAIVPRVLELLLLICSELLKSSLEPTYCRFVAANSVGIASVATLW